jgi:hypothetical protein
MRTRKRKLTFAQKAYLTTKVPAGNTRAQIEKMLEGLNITETRITKVGSDYTVEFLVKMNTQEFPRKIKIDVPINSELGEDLKTAEKKKNMVFRVLYWHLRNKFIAVAKGLKEFEEEFMSDLVIKVGKDEVRLGDIILPKYKAQLKNHAVAVFAIDSGKGGEEK